MKTVFIIVLLFICLLLMGCAAAANELRDTPGTEGKIAGFWQGLWHGIIAPIMFIVSLFNHNVSIYAVHNNGGWYNFGFLLGLAMVLGGGGNRAAHATRHN